MDPQQRNVLSFINALNQQQQIQQQSHPPFPLPNDISQAVLTQMMGERSLERNSLGN